MTRVVDALVALQTALDTRAEAADKLENLPRPMRELHQRHSKRRAQIDEQQQRIDDAGQQRRKAEAEAEEWQQKLDRLQQQIREVRTQREYGAILSEIDQATEQKNAVESVALEAMEQAETAGQELETLNADFEDLDREYQQALEQWQKDKPGVESLRDEMTQRVEELRAQLPAGVGARFERVLEHAGGQAMSAVVPVDRGKGASLWACSNCSYRVRPQAVVEIRSHGKVVQCEGCRRFLYLEETKEASA